MMALGWMISIYQRGNAAMKRLGEIFETVPAIASPATPSIPAAVRGEIRFEGVAFSHAARNGATPILTGVDLVVPAGSKLGVIGRTGSGKSTLAMLIPRMFDVTQGRVTVDGVDVRAWDLQMLRGAIGFVPQDPFLFSESIGRNIEFSAGTLGDEEIMQLVEIAGLDADLAGFPHGLETEVGERGITLSGGQKQRLTLARAIAGDRRILVLDDALSSVDAQTERRILDELKTAMAGRTSIIISHRVSSVKDADAIVVVEEGRVVERGTHAELLGVGGLYAELYQRQRLTEQLEAM
jgi:ATP-binding cassette subfamily B protein